MENQQTENESKNSFCRRPPLSQAGTEPLTISKGENKPFCLASGAAVSSWSQNAGTAWWVKALEKKVLCN